MIIMDNSINNNSGQKDAFALLASVLIISALALMLAVSILLSNVDAARGSRLQLSLAQADAWSDSCIDSALFAIAASSTLALPGSLSGASGSCSYEIVDLGGPSRLIRSSGISGEALRRRLVELDQVAPPRILHSRIVASF
jgi:hypothetical protein